MPRSPLLEFEGVRVEGGLIAPDYLLQVAELKGAAQEPADYGVPRGLTVRDEIGRAWRIAEAHWHDLQRLGAGAGVRRDRAVVAMLRDAFGWVSITPLDAPCEVADRAYPLSAMALEGTVPLVVAGGDRGLDDALPRWGDGTRRRSAFGVVQEYLNAAEGAVWGVATNGRQLRIVRDNASLTRPAWIEADLARIFEEQRYADFSLLWLLLHQRRFGTAGRLAHEAPLEQWRAAALEVGTVARDRLREGVEQALRALGNGFLAHPHNLALRDRLTSGALDAAGYHQQLLRLVYRMIFLLVAEERELLHAEGADPEGVRCYREGYGLQRLRERVVQRRGYDRHDDAWEALRVVWRGCARGESRLGLTALGGLFAADQCPDLEKARLGNRALLEAVFRLTWLRQGSAIARVNWRDMGTEELGSVYESLLELVPEVPDGARRFGFVGDPAGGVNADGGSGEGAGGTRGNARKLTGSYYTPDSLVQALLDSALEPVIAQAVRQDDPERALLQLALLDPSMGSGHFLLGAGRRLAGHLARLRVDGTPGPALFRQALREVIGHCLYGVDKNAMAVELARMALWLEAMEPGKPLAFLDHHLVHGDAILGVQSLAVLGNGIPDDAFKPLTGCDSEVARELGKANRAARRVLEQETRGGQYTLRFDAVALARELAAVDALPDGTLEQVEAKRRALAAAQGAGDAAVRLACDAYVAAFLLRKDHAGRAGVPTTSTLRDLATGVAVPAAVREAVGAVAQAVPFLHWPLAFAPVMARGGFDCVVGNPPWEKVKLSEKEFFESRDADIARAANAAVREEKIRALALAEPGSPPRRLYEAFQLAKQEAEGASRYARTGGRFPLTGTGDVNLYALFAEGVLGVVRRGGRAGLVLPSGIASDAGTAPFFRHVANGRLVSLVDFENREKLFAAVDSRMKFCLLTMGEGAVPQFAFFLTQPAQRFDERRRFTLSAEDLRRLNPNTGNAPVFRSRADAELTSKIYRNVPVLWDETREDGNPWGLSFATLFHMSNDSGLFHRAPGPGLVPLYEAKMIHQFDHRWATYTGGDEDAVRDVTETEKADPAFEVRPRYWVPQEEVEARLAAKGWGHPWLLAMRLIARATDERTILVSPIPRVGLGHSCVALMTSPDRERDFGQWACLAAILNSLVVDYVARQKVGGMNIGLFMLRQLPVLAPSMLQNSDVNFIATRVLGIGFHSHNPQGWLATLQLRWRFEQSTSKEVQKAELDAYFAMLYGLSREDLVFLLDPHETFGPEYPTETFRILKDSDRARFGEYRTRRLVLEAWDRLFGSA